MYAGACCLDVSAYMSEEVITFSKSVFTPESKKVIFSKPVEFAAEYEPDRDAVS